MQQKQIGCGLGSLGICVVSELSLCLSKPGGVNIIILVICGTSFQVLLPHAVLFGLPCSAKQNSGHSDWPGEEVQQLCPVGLFC